MTMEPPCRVIEGIVAGFQGRALHTRGLSILRIFGRCHHFDDPGELGPWGSPQSTVPMRSPETEQTFAVASGRTKSAWPGPAFVVFVSRPSSPSLCPLFPSTTLCGNTASLWRWAGADGSDLGFPFVEAFPSGLREKPRIRLQSWFRDRSESSNGTLILSCAAKATSVPEILEGAFPRPQTTERPPGSDVCPIVSAAKGVEVALAQTRAKLAKLFSQGPDSLRCGSRITRLLGISTHHRGNTASRIGAHLDQKGTSMVDRLLRLRGHLHLRMGSSVLPPTRVVNP